jgi:hypothetical protein
MAIQQHADPFQCRVCNNIHVLFHEMGIDPNRIQERTNREDFVQFCMMPFTTESLFAPSSLSGVLHFCQMIASVKKKNPSKNILVLARASLNSQVTSVFLVGCHAILSGLSYDQVASSFRDMEVILGSIKYSVDLDIYDFWRAFARSKELSWIGDGDEESPSDCDSGDLNLE